MNPVQLAVLKPPEDVLRAIAAPAEVRGVPAEEVGRPVRQELRVVGGAPAAHDRIAGKVDVDFALLRLRQQLRVRDRRVLVGPRRGLIGRRRHRLTRN